MSTPLDVRREQDNNAPPMPLKHPTETFFIILLGCVIALTGMLASLLPHFPEGVLPWASLVVLVTAYPLVLLSTFKDNRADYELRVLHWAPLAIVLFWGVLEIIGAFVPLASTIQLGFSYLWSLPAVLLGLGLLIFFCMHVIRCWNLRVSLLTTVFFLFLACAVASQAGGWNADLTERIYVQHVTNSALGQRVVTLVSPWFPRHATLAKTKTRPQHTVSDTKISSSKKTSGKSTVEAKDVDLAKSGPIETFLSSLLIAAAIACASAHRKTTMERVKGIV